MKHRDALVGKLLNQKLLEHRVKMSSQVLGGVKEERTVDRSLNEERNVMFLMAWPRTVPKEIGCIHSITLILITVVPLMFPVCGVFKVLQPIKEKANRWVQGFIFSSVVST